MTPVEAIQTATRNAAEALHLDADLGTLEAGKIAEVLLVDGDPSTDINCLTERENIKVVFKDGYRYVDRREGHDRHVLPREYREWKVIDA